MAFACLPGRDFDGATREVTIKPGDGIVEEVLLKERLAGGFRGLPLKGSGVQEFRVWMPPFKIQHEGSGLGAVS